MQDWLTHRVRATPERTALVRAATGETLSVATLDALVDDLAGRLAALGVETGDHLGLVTETSLAAVCTVYAAERLGAVLVPVGDDRPAAELAAQLELADVSTLVCSADTETRAVEAFDGPICSVDDATAEAVDSLGEVPSADVTPATWALSDDRLLLFTSGTTGTPKAVRLTAGNLLWSAVTSAFRLGLHDDDRWLVGLSLHHMGGLSPVVRMPLYGMTVVLQESFDAGRTADNIGNHDVTGVSVVPTMLSRMLDVRGTLADSLRVVLLGGAPAPDELVTRCRDFSIPVHPTYGMTETASQIATATPKEAFADVGTVGRPLLFTTVTVRDDDGGEVPTGELGEFVVEGPTVSPGYYAAAETTERTFGPNGLRTGDVGYRDEHGRLFVSGRVDDRIITGGENVYPDEVAEILRAHPSVEDAAVVGIPDDEWGERVGALVVTTGEELTVADVDAHCRERLAGFKLPRAVSFVDELPRTESGTVEREAVRELLVADATVPDAESEAVRGGEEAPTTSDDGRAAAESGAVDVDGDGDAVADVADAESTAAGEGEHTGDGPGADSFLFGSERWLPRSTPDEDDADETADVVTDRPTDADAGGDAPDAPEDAGEPEVPDFVQDALAVDETGSPAAGSEDETAVTDDTTPSERSAGIDEDDAESTTGRGAGDDIDNGIGDDGEAAGDGRTDSDDDTADATDDDGTSSGS
jgi:O-succinylbenzoic acid--CoA ligase